MQVREGVTTEQLVKSLAKLNLKYAEFSKNPALDASGRLAERTALMYNGIEEELIKRGYYDN